MLHFFTKPAEARVHVVEPLVALRSVMVEALRHQGFAQVTGFGDLKTMLDHLSIEATDWILSASCTNNDINIMHLLKLCIDEPRLRNTRVSFLMRENEKDLLPLAFELGLLSFHVTTIPSRIPDEIGDLTRVLRMVGYNGTLVAANFLCRYLKENRLWDPIVFLQKTLLEVFPGSSHILLAMAEAELCSGREEGRQTLQQILLLDVDMGAEVEQLRNRFAPGDSLDMPLDLDVQIQPKLRHNALGLESCILVDPDTSVHHAIRQSLKIAGIENLETFESGLSAWKWLNNGGRPSLILMEWRLPELSGMQFAQRVSQDFPGIPIVIVSSLVTQADTPLLKELGVRGIVEKPFEAASLMAEMVNAIQQHRYPTEQSAMDRRILHCLGTGNRVEASRLLAIYLSHAAYDEVGKIRMEAEFAFFEGKFRQCCALALDALKITGDAVELLNLLGKALMKLGDYENALRLLEKANALSPKNIERICRLASLCTELQKTEEAESWLAKAKSIDASNTLVAETEASMAIESHDSERATEAMKELESLHRIVAYTNNKAIAKIRGNQFEEGINLYKTALASLPNPWSAIHETVCFNLALAYVRFFQYPEARDILASIRTEPPSAMSSKALALKTKIEHAIKSQTHLQFAPEPVPEPAGKESAEAPIDLKQMIDSLVPVRGDICCYRVFQAQTMASEASRKLLLNMPRLLKRPPIRRDESLPQKSIKSQAS